MLPAFLLKTIVKQVIKAVIKTPDKKLVSSHEKRLKRIEKKLKIK